MSSDLQTPRELATGIVRRLRESGCTAYWVGGCVRDFLLGREPGDYDIATNALPEAVEKIFSRTVPVGRKFGVIVVIEEGHQFQVATFRAESDYQDGRRPEQVTFGDARADASRRDFTVNGLFYDPIKGELHDWVGGEKDLCARVLRTIGDPAERFAEDHLRLLRAVRFAAQLGFEIEPGTFVAIREFAPKLKSISPERIREELVKLFQPPHAARGLVLLQKSGLLEHILPELAATVACDQSPDHHPEGSVFNHISLMLEQMPTGTDPLLPWAVLMHDIAKPVTARRDEHTGSIHFYDHERVGAMMAGEIMRRLRFSNHEIEIVETCVRMHMQFKDALKMRKSTLRRLLLRDTFPLELELHRLDCLGSHARLDIYEFLKQQAEELAKMPQLRPPLLTGADLIALGASPGPALGALLAELREKQLADELTTKEAALRWVEKNIRVSDG